MDTYTPKALPLNAPEAQLTKPPRPQQPRGWTRRAAVVAEQGSVGGCMRPAKTQYAELERTHAGPVYGRPGLDPPNTADPKPKAKKPSKPESLGRIYIDWGAVTKAPPSLTRGSVPKCG